MIIGLNLLYLLPRIVCGTETYAAGLIGGLAEIDKQNEYYVFVNRESAEWPLPDRPNFTRVVCPVSSVSRSTRYFYEQVRLPKLLKKYRVDVLHSLGYVGPLYSPCPSIVTIHDLHYIDIAHNLGLIKRIMLRFFSTQSAQRANYIIAVSQFTKERLYRALKISSEKVVVTYEAAGEIGNLNMVMSSGELLQSYVIKKPYIVAFSGDGKVHKNIPRLINAFIALKEHCNHNLVLIGRLPPDIDLTALLKEEGMENRIVSTGYVPNAHIGTLLSNADVFVFPSLYEGFGIPILEAQQAGVAVACSSTGSLPEVAGHGAVFFDPNSVESITQTIDKCISDNNLRTELRCLGQENLKRFSWGKMARETLSVYQRIISKT